MPKGIYLRNPKSLEERFWEKVDKNGPIPTHVPDLGPCWIWTACRSYNGYGWIKSKGKMNKAHRVSYELRKGPIPVGKLILHKCDNPACVNPDHLWIGTNLDNAKDRNKKNRQARLNGEDNVNSKLTEENVREAWKLKSQGLVQREIAKPFGVSCQQISRILTRKQWKHLVIEN